MRVLNFIFISFFLFELSISAQNDSIFRKNNTNADDIINQNVELLSEQLELEEGDLSNLTEVWTYYKSNPINLNRTDKEQLQELQLLTDIQISNLLKHREVNGNLISIYELQSINGFDLITIKKYFLLFM